MPSKDEIRRTVAAQKHLRSREVLRLMSEEITSRLESHALFRAAQTVLLYRSLPGEVSTAPLLRCHNEKRILLPAVVGPVLELRIYNGEDSLRRGASGVFEPEGAAFTDYGRIGLAVIPGIAFDRRGNRLGRGGGYYDRLLAELKKTGIPTVGLCFCFQKFDAIPVEAHDIPVDEVL